MKKLALASFFVYQKHTAGIKINILLVWAVGGNPRSLW